MTTQIERVAIVRAREQAAQARAEELVGANARLAEVIGLLHSVGRFSEMLLTLRHFREIDNALGVLGEAANVDRVYMILIEGSPAVASLNAFWLKPGIAGYPEGLTISESEMPEVFAVLLRHESYQGDPFTRSGDNAAFHESVDTLSDLILPIIVRGELCGAIGFDGCHRVRSWSEEEIRALQVAAAMLGSAIERQRVEQEARETIGHERERAAQQRAAGLSLANEALKREVSERKRAEAVARGQAEALSQSIRIAAQETDIDEFVGLALNIITYQLHAPGSCLWIFDEQSQLSLHTACSNGSCRRGAEFALELQTIFDPTHPRGLALLSGKPIVIRDVPTDVSLAELRGYYDSLHVRSLLVVPLVAGERVLGSVNVYGTEDADWSPEDIELAEALVKQIGLAMQLTSLTEQAKSAAISREKEIAAQERASELMNVNATITESFRKMSSQPDTSAAPQVLLVDIAQAASADVCYWLDYDPISEALNVSMRCRDGRLQDSPEEYEPLLLQGPFRADLVSGLFRPSLTDGFNILSVERQPEMLWPETADWHRRAGRKQVLCFPVSLGDKPIGMLAMAFCEETNWSNARKEIVRALANHLALSTHLHGLSEQARRGAAIEERSRLAREIHDTMAQHFSGILVQLRAMQSATAMNDEQAESFHAGNALELAQFGLLEARRSLASLRPVELDGRSLREALILMAESAQKRSGIPVRVVHSVDIVLEGHHEAELLRIAQECVTNALKHASASQITIRLSRVDSLTELCVVDDGHGFDQGRATEGFGLTGIHERALRIGATIAIESSDRGTSVCVQMSRGGAIGRY